MNQTTRATTNSLPNKKSGAQTSQQLSDEQQHKRFIETARALECDEDQERFEEKLRQIATSKPNPKKPRKS
jgi:hypothetical protein